MQRRHIIHRLAALAAWGAAGPAMAQGTYPSRAIHWLVPYSPGGGMDKMGRALAERMRGPLGQQILVDNYAGGASNIAAEHVVRAKADGHTILQADNAVLALNEHLFRKLSFDPQKDLVHIGGIARVGLALVVRADFPAHNLAGFLAAVRARPGLFHYASPGGGTPHHLAMELFMARTGIQMTHVAYPGARPAVQDLVAAGGPVCAMFLDLPSGLPEMLSGKLKTLAVSRPQRAPQLPDVPTLAQEGVEDAEVFAFLGLLGPAGLAQDIVTRLNQELNRALSDGEIVRQFSENGIEILRTTPDEFRDMARAESKRWGEVIRNQGISVG